MASGSSAGTEEFCRSLLEFQQYPDNIPLQERPKLVSIFKHHFQEAKNRITLITPGRRTGARYAAALRKVCLFISDRGKGGHEAPSPEGADTDQIPKPSGSSTSDTEAEYSEVIFRPEQLENLLGIPQVRRFSLDGRIHTVALPADPVARFIFLETSPGTTGGRRINVTTDMLLQILTYHHVSPSFLNFISYYGWQPLTSDSDLLFGNLRCLKSFSRSEFGVQALGRSGRHYQLVFELKTVFDPLHWNDTGEMEEYEERDMGETPEQKRKGLFSWLGRWRKEDAYEPELGTDYSKYKPWPIMQTAVYHRFDVVNGRSLWIVTTGDKKPRVTNEDDYVRPEYFDVKDVAKVAKVTADTPTEQRFKSSLDVMVWLMEWSLSEYGFYIARLDGSLGTLTQIPATSGASFDMIKEEELKVVNRLIESVDQCIVGLTANMRVAEALSKFYRNELLQNHELEDLSWITEAQDTAQIDAEKAADALMGIYSETNYMLQRAVVVKQMGTRREDIIHRLIQNRNEQTMRSLAEITYKDSTTMRVFSKVTLILLPMSVVSTLFTTDIVQFKDTPGFVGSWSGPAAIWWTGATLLATLIVYVASESYRKVAISKPMGGEPPGVRAVSAPQSRPSHNDKQRKAWPLTWFSFSLFKRRSDEDSIDLPFTPQVGWTDNDVETGSKVGWGLLPRWATTTVKEFRARSGSTPGDENAESTGPHIGISRFDVGDENMAEPQPQSARQSGRDKESFNQGDEMERGQSWGDVE